MEQTLGQTVKSLSLGIGFSKRPEVLRQWSPVWLQLSRGSSMGAELQAKICLPRRSPHSVAASVSDFCNLHMPPGEEPFSKSPTLRGWGEQMSFILADSGSSRGMTRWTFQGHLSEHGGEDDLE